MEIGFTGEIHQAECPCHKGQFLMAVFCIRENLPRAFCGNKMFETKQLAEQNLEATVNECADAILSQMGLSQDTANERIVSHGEAAFAAESKLRNETNPNLH